jgi:thiamine-monophosphate kinase
VTEWELIERYFRELGAPREDVVLGIGDDAALLRVPAECELAMTTDALIEGVHFLAGAPAQSLGHRALAVNLSDIAAMGASPSWALLSLNLPSIDEAWLREFALGFGALAQQHGVCLVGGNLSRGALSITVQLGGLVPAGRALRRNGARAGDGLYVSGTPGDAAQGCELVGQTLLDRAQVDQGRAPEDTRTRYLVHRFEYPTPRVALGEALRGVASACIDISDGLYADAARLLEASGCGAEVSIESLPLSEAMQHTLADQAWRAVLRGGEDYELCFTVPPERAAFLGALGARVGVPLTRIGVLTASHGIAVKSGENTIAESFCGFEHFSQRLNGNSTHKVV